MREILLHVEQGQNASGWFEARGNKFFVDTDEYQIALLEQAGFLETDFGTLGSAIPDDLRITFSGHDYLDAIRSESIWQETKNAVAETGGNATLEILKALAIGFLKKKISQHTDIELG